MNPLKRKHEDCLSSLSAERGFSKALFYMYGGLEGVADNSLLVHHLLRVNGVWTGTDDDAKKYLKK